MHSMVRLFLIAVVFLIAEVGASHAATKKAQPSILAENAPMSVVIVRLASANCEPNCPEWIAARGDITPNTPARFRKVFKQLGNRKLPILIESPGGSIEAAIEIGKMVRKRGLEVGVAKNYLVTCADESDRCKILAKRGVYLAYAYSPSAYCNSACPIILSGGVQRYVSDRAYIGVHKPRRTITREMIREKVSWRIKNGKKIITKREIVKRTKMKPKFADGYDQTLRRTLTAYYKGMGVDPAIIKESELAEYSDMRSLNVVRLVGLNLRNSPRDPASFAASGSCANAEAKHCFRLALKSEVAKTVQPSAEKPLTAQPLTAQPLTAMKFNIVRNADSRCEPECPEWIAAEGSIVADTPDLFAKFMASADQKKRMLVINSPGGDFAAAMKLGFLFRNNQVTVTSGETRYASCNPAKSNCVEVSRRGYVSGTASDLVRNACSGSCMVAWLGGKKRSAQGVLLQHPTDYESKSDLSAGLKLQAYMKELGYSPDAFLAFVQVQPRQTYPIGLDHLTRTGLISIDPSSVGIDHIRACKMNNRIVSCIRR
jgi:hypothetical protein